MNLRLRRRAFWNARCRGEDGLTLNELLVAMVVSAIIVIPIGGAMFTSLHTSGSTMNRTGQNIGTNLFSTYFGTDVQNAVQVGTNVAESPAVCGGTAQTVDLLLTTSPALSSISYYRGTGSNSVNLYRRTCSVTGGTGSASAPILLMRSVSGPPAFTCAPDCGDATWRTVTGVVPQADSLNPTAFTTRVQASRRTS